MHRSLRAVLLALVFAGPLGAQNFSVDNSTATRWMLDTESGSESGLGFKIPHLAVGIGAERSVGKHFELQGRLSYSPDRKYITNDGKSLLMKSRGLYWITPKFALTGGLHRSYLWTSQFNKSSWSPSAGIAFREGGFGMPGRIYFDYLFPTGCQWGASCPIQSNRTQGVDFYWETRVASHFRLGLLFGTYHLRNQSNQFRPDIPRSGVITGDMLVTLRYEFHRGSMDKLY